MATPIKDNTTALEELLDRARALPSIPGSVEQATPTISVSSSGLITASVTQEAGVVDAGTKSATRQLPTKGATTIEPSDSVQTAVSAGTYVTGDINVAAAEGGQIVAGTVIPTSDSNILSLTCPFTVRALFLFSDYAFCYGRWFEGTGSYVDGGKFKSYPMTMTQNNNSLTITIEENGKFYGDISIDYFAVQ